VVLGDFRIDKLMAQRFQAFERAFLVRPISREYPATSAASMAASRRSARNRCPEFIAAAPFRGDPTAILAFATARPARFAPVSPFNGGRQ
jgi:hypothetical protein